VSRNLDVAIAEALGYQIYHENYQKDLWHYFKPEPDGEYIGALPHYSKDGNAMLELDREMQARGFMLMVEVYNEGYSASYWICHAKEWADDYVSDNMPKAVALAAYKALTGKEWQE
jgi:hypothetical protein